MSLTQITSVEDIIVVVKTHNIVEGIIEDILARTPRVIDQVGAHLPSGFPVDVFEAIRGGLLESARRLEVDTAL